MKENQNTASKKKKNKNREGCQTAIFFRSNIVETIYICVSPAVLRHLQGAAASSQGHYGII